LPGMHICRIADWPRLIYYDFESCRVPVFIKRVASV
jgi:hypothetical protein